MKKKICILLLTIGIFLISLGLFLFVNSNSKQEVKTVDVKELKVDTSVIVGDNIDNSLYSYYVKNNLVKTTLKDFDIGRRNLYEIKVPGDLIESYLSDYGKLLSSDNINVEIYSDPSFDIDNFINESVDYYNNYGYSMINYSLNKNVKCDNYSCGYIKFIAKRDDVTPHEVEGYIEKFVFFIKVDDCFCVYSFVLDNMKFSDEFLTEIINSFNIDSDKAKYTYTTLKDDLLYGEIKQVKINSNYGYKINYTLLHSVYNEVESADNNIYSNNFKFGDDNLLNIKVVSAETNIIEYIEDSNKNLFKDYEEVFYKNEEAMYRDKKYISIKAKYTIESLDEDVYMYNFIYNIDNGVALSITITTNDEFDADKFMDEFNFKVEKYNHLSLIESKVG